MYFSYLELHNLVFKNTCKRNIQFRLPTLEQTRGTLSKKFRDQIYATRTYTLLYTGRIFTPK